MAIAVLLVFLVSSYCHGEEIDMAPYQDLILKLHNDYRREEPAANMNKMQWSDKAESAARKWIQKCEAGHQGAGWGENLAWKDTNNPDINAVISGFMKAWHAEKPYYTFGQTNCGTNPASCHYVQIIWGPTRFVGCALKKCNIFKMGNRDFPTPMYYMACFYTPRSYAGSDEFEPYQHGSPCAKCPGEHTCDQGLCVSAAGEDNELGTGGKGGKGGGQPGGGGFQNEQPTEGNTLEPREKQDILNEHNILRKGHGLTPLVWDDVEESTANYIINCEVEYGAQQSDYVNHGKAKYGTLHQLVLRWIKEGPNTDLKGNGCRSLQGGDDCSHYSNMVQPGTTKMACASKACGQDVGRQLTCLYTA